MSKVIKIKFSNLLHNMYLVCNFPKHFIVKHCIDMTKFHICLILWIEQIHKLKSLQIPSVTKFFYCCCSMCWLK